LKVIQSVALFVALVTRSVHGSHNARAPNFADSGAIRSASITPSGRRTSFVRGTLFAR
jgi:hypothetical protein